MKIMYGYIISVILIADLLLFSIDISPIVMLALSAVSVLFIAILSIKTESLLIVISSAVGIIYVVFLNLSMLVEIIRSLIPLPISAEPNTMYIVALIVSIPLVRIAIKYFKDRRLKRYISNDLLIFKSSKPRSILDLSNILIYSGLIVVTEVSIYIVAGSFRLPYIGEIYRPLFYIYILGSVLTVLVSWRFGSISILYGLGSIISLPSSLARSIADARKSYILEGGKGDLKLIIENTDLQDPYIRAPLTLSLETGTSPHILVSGSTGMGKTTFCKKLASSARRVGVSVIVLDFHGEYKDLEGFKVIDSSIEVPQIIPSSRDPKESILELVDSIRSIFKLGTVQTSVLTSILESYIRSGGNSFKDLLKYVENILNESKNSAVRDPAYSLIPYLRILATHLGDRVLDIERVVNEYRYIVIDLNRLGSEYAVRVYVEYLMKNLWNWKISKGHRNLVDLIVIIDEAHNVLKGSLRNFISKIIRESRKYGLSMVISTQQISEIPESILNNIGVFIVFRSIEADNISKIITSTSGDIYPKRSLETAIPRLKPLQAVVFNTSTGSIYKLVIKKY